MLYKFPWHNLLKTELYFCQNLTEFHPFSHNYGKMAVSDANFGVKNVLVHQPELELEVPLFVSN
jgi:hypothetical protein